MRPARLNRRLTGELVELAGRDRTKLILAGDPKQMQPLDSGGPFRVIDRFTEPKDKIELTVNRRQRDAAERRQLALVRAGDTGEALEGYMRHGQVVQSPDGAAVRMRMVADWWEAYRGGKDTLLLGRRHIDVDLLNQMARRRCVEGGLVGGPAITHEGKLYQAGDQLLCLRNDNRRGGLSVRNGMRGRIDQVDPGGRRLHVTLRGGKERWIPVDHYPHVAHGWAMTVEKAQGQTVDRAFVMRPASAGQEWHYTALSRGREPVKYYLVSRNPEPDVEGTSHAGERDDHRTVEQTLAHQWQRVEATELSVDFPARDSVEGGRAEEVDIPDQSTAPPCMPDLGGGAVSPATDGADREVPVDDPVAEATAVMTDEPRAVAAAPAEKELDQRLSDAFDAQLDRERQELEAEDQVTASREVTDERDAVTTTNERMTAGPEQRFEKSLETDADTDGLTWESERESGRPSGLEM